MKWFLTQCGIREILTLAAGVFTAQGITYIAQPVLTRMYPPEAFGIHALIVSIVTMFTPVATCQYDQFIVITDSDEEAKRLAALSFHIVAAVTGAVGLGLFINRRLVRHSAFLEAGIWVYLSVPLLFLTGVIQILTAYNNRLCHYHIIARVNVFRTFSQSAFKCLFGIWNKSFIGLTLGTIIGCLAGIREQAGGLNGKRKELFSYEKRELWETAKKYRRQPLFSMPGFFVSNLSYSMLPVMIAHLYGPEEVGFFSISMTMLGIPLGIFSDSIGKVFLKKASEEKALYGSFSVSYRNLSALLVFLALPVFAGMFFIAEPAFRIVFGQRWMRSGLFAKILIPLYMIRFVVSIVAYGLVISGRQPAKLAIQIFFCVEAAAVFMFCSHQSLGIEMFLKLIGLSYSCNYMLMWIAGYRASRGKGGNDE